ncbi:MAG: hypothetical protein M1827_001136 [Pycnora praestabilis]|nr:MAG: hypothetical protein M1827_001136 [Pycnora praestabilis]
MEANTNESTSSLAPTRSGGPVPLRLAIPPSQCEPMIDSDSGTSSDGEASDGVRLPEDDAQSVIGISISRAQTRLTSPQTPAVEKAAALNKFNGSGFFGEEKGPNGTAIADEVEEQVTSWNKPPSLSARCEKQLQLSNVSDGLRESSGPKVRSPRRQGPEASGRSVLRDALGPNRQRASSGPSSLSHDFKKLIPFSLSTLQRSPRLSNFSLPSLPPSLCFLSSHKTAEDLDDATVNKRRGANTFFSDIATSWTEASSTDKAEPEKYFTSLDGASPSRIERLKESNGAEPQELRKPAIPPTEPSTHELKSVRRVASDNSLLLNRSLSRVSSLGDDSRFEHVQDQVNSRFKAIKDSFQDSSFKLPSLPNIPSMNLNALRFPDFVALKSDVDDHRAPKQDQTDKNSGASGVKATKNPESLASSMNTAPSKPASHPYFTHALDDLTGDVVIMGGYRGSILRSAKPPYRQLWIPVKVGLNLRKVDLEVGLEAADEENMPDTIRPSGMLTHIGPVDMSRRLFKRLRSSEKAQKGELRVWDYGYDWRLSPHLLSQQLVKYMEGLPSNAPGTPPEQKGATVIAHSLGGLITRHAINQRPDLFAGVVYAGVPQTCVNILGPLRNGDEVLFSSRVLTAQVNFTLRTSYVLLPEDGKCFIDKDTMEEYPMDFFDVKTWIDHCLSPCVASPLPPIPPASNGHGGWVGSISGMMPNLPLAAKRAAFFTHDGESTSLEDSTKTKLGDPTDIIEASAKAVRTEAGNIAGEASGEKDHTMAPQMGKLSNPVAAGKTMNSSVSTAVTIPRDQAIAYLTRTLSEIRQFKQELHFRPSHSESNSYPPVAVLYGRTVPTVYGARVDGREGIKRADAYDSLAFGSGDGVVLARAAMVPTGYQVVKGGKASSDRGHVTLLGDLEAVGRCLSAVTAGRKRGIGLGYE